MQENERAADRLILNSRQQLNFPGLIWRNNYDRAFLGRNNESN
jgi:hypothetical protein